MDDYKQTIRLYNILKRITVRGKKKKINKRNWYLKRREKKNLQSIVQGYENQLVVGKAWELITL